MKLKAHFGFKGLLAVTLAVWLMPVVASRAEALYLPAGKLDGIALLGPPPEAGSEEAAADLLSARSVFKARTTQEGAIATMDATLSLFNFGPIIGPEFTAKNFPKTRALYEKMKPDLHAVIDPVKSFWKRQRPYQVDTNLTFGPLEPSASYPSGHSMCGMVQALLLAELFPEKRDALLAFGRQIGWDRVLIGKHFPTDVRAGRVLGQAFIHEMLANPKFQQDLAEAKAEVAAVEKR